MQYRPNEQLLVALQQAVSAALREWLTENKEEVLQMIRQGVFESDTACHERRQQQIKRSEVLTVAEGARRLQLHPESVRRMIRQGRIRTLRVGNRNRVALSTLEKFEHDGVVPGCRKGTTGPLAR